MVIALDVDDVVADLMTAWANAYNREYGDNLTPASFKSWAVHEWVSQDCGEKFYDYLTAELYESVQPVPDALWGINILRQRGHTVLFVTAGLGEIKQAWLQQHGFLTGGGVYGNGRTYAEFFACYAKERVAADVLVDDRPDNLESFVQFDGARQGILFSRPHNAAFDWGRRAETWRDIVHFIDAIDQHDAEAEEARWVQEQNTLRQLVNHRMREVGLEPVPATVLPTIERQDLVLSDDRPSRPEDVANHGVKYDTGKTMWSLLPWDVLDELAGLYTIGARKYAARNWERGFAWSRSFDAAQRHLYKWWFLREELDDETQARHIIAALWNLCALARFGKDKLEFDDRPPALEKRRGASE